MGGVDSSLVTAIIQSNSDVPINTFTIGFDDCNYDESKYAKAIANYLGTAHTEYICTKDDALDIIQKLPMIFDEPFADSSAIPTTLVSRLAKEKVSVVLSGDGGDEIFCGYSSYPLMKRRFSFISKLLFRKAIILVLRSCLPLLFVFNKLNERFYLKLMKFRDAIEHVDIENAFRVSNSVFCKDEVERVLNGDYFFQADSVTGAGQLERMMISDFRGYLPDDLLTKVDRATMSASLEGREPLLDHKIIEYAAKMPIEFKQNKRILKEILSRYLPEELFLRKKKGFGIPINAWLRCELRHLLEHYLSKDLVEKYGVINFEYVQDLLVLFYSGSNDDRKIWTLLMFQMWYAENVASDSLVFDENR